MPVEITTALIKRIAGKTTYDRGKDYYQDQLVDDFQNINGKITADVQGTELYQVHLNLTGNHLDGYCDCPASEGIDFCKHCVAVGLYQLKEHQQIEQLQTGNSDQNKIKAYLLQQPKEKLTDQLLEFITSDRSLLNSYLLKIATTGGNIDYKALKKRITSVTPKKTTLSL